MGVPGQKSALRPFICVGIAYFLIAVLFPIGVLQTKGEKGNWSMTGIVWSFSAGLVGAIGALGIIMAFKCQGKPFYVMPLVFGLAPVVNTFTSMFMAGTYRQASTVFFAGVLIVAVGAGGVLYFKPAPAKKTEAPEKATETVAVNQVSFVKQEDDDSKSDSSDTSDQAAPLETKEQAGDGQVPENSKLESTAKPESKANLWLVGLCIGITALCWGAYGPVLHKGQAKMNGSRLRPFLCVGLAYFAIAVVVPLILSPMPMFQEPGGWPIKGSAWSLLAGAAGAVGALGIIYAFNVGGKPVFIMPLVFGFAPVVNTFTEIVSKNLLSQVPASFYISLGMVICGAVVVLTNAPRPQKPKPAEEAATE